MEHLGVNTPSANEWSPPSEPEYEQRQSDLREVRRALNYTPPPPLSQNVLDYAQEAWRFLNPNSTLFDDDTRRHVYRFQSKENHFSDDFYETNWDHTCKMVRGYVNLCQYFSNVMAGFNHETAIKMILLHDTPEFYRGDVPLNQQTEEVKTQKVQDEHAAIEMIKTISPLGAGIVAILAQYEAKETKESILVKVLDNLAGQDSFAELLLKYLPPTSEEVEQDTGLDRLEYSEYLYNDQLDRSDLVFNKWTTKLMEFFGLNDYKPDFWRYADSDRKQLKQILSPEVFAWYIKSFEESAPRLRQVEPMADTDNPAANFFHALTSFHYSLRAFITEIQYYIDFDNFRESLADAKNRKGLTVFDNINLFGDPADVAAITSGDHWPRQP